MPRFRSRSTALISGGGGGPASSADIIYLGHPETIDGVYYPAGVRSYSNADMRLTLASPVPYMVDVMGEPVFLSTATITAIKVRHPDYPTEDFDTGPHVENAPYALGPLRMGYMGGSSTACNGIYSTANLSISLAGSGVELGPGMNTPPLDTQWQAGISVYYAFAYNDGTTHYQDSYAIINSISDDGTCVTLAEIFSPAIPDGSRVYGWLDNSACSPPIYCRHGIRKNPIADGQQPYDPRAYQSDFNLSNLSALPLVLTPGDAAIICDSRPHNDTSRTDCNNTVQTVSAVTTIGYFVLTCMSATPATDFYRPSPYDRTQTVFKRSDYVYSSSLPSLSTAFAGGLGRFAIADQGSWPTRHNQFAAAIDFYPYEFFGSAGGTMHGLFHSAYYREAQEDFSDISCLLCSDITGKQSLLDATIKAGLDQWYAIKSIALWNADSSVTENCFTLSTRPDKNWVKFPVVFAGWIFNVSEIAIMTLPGAYPTGGQVLSQGTGIQFYKTDILTYYGADRTPVQTPWTGWVTTSAMHRLVGDETTPVSSEFDNDIPFDFNKIQNRVSLGMFSSSCATQSVTVRGWLSSGYTGFTEESIIVSGINLSSSLTSTTNIYDTLQSISYERTLVGTSDRGLLMYVGPSPVASSPSNTRLVLEEISLSSTPRGPITYWAYNWARGNSTDYNYLWKSHGYSMNTNLRVMLGMPFMGSQIPLFKSFWQHDAFFDWADRWMKEPNVAWGIYYLTSYTAGGKSWSAVKPTGAAASNVTGSVLFLSNSPDLSDVQDGKCPIWINSSTNATGPSAATIVSHDNSAKTVITRVPLTCSGTSTSWTIGFLQVQPEGPTYKIKYGAQTQDWQTTGSYPPGTTNPGYDFGASYSFCRNFWKTYIPGVVP